MKSKIIIAIACNTIGAAIIAIGARFENLPAAIATTTAGTVVSVSGAAYAIARESQELIEARKQALHLLKENQRHIQQKSILLIEFEDLKARVQEAEEQYAKAEEQFAIVLSTLQVDAEKLEKAELN